jgi:hypothetical protein
MNFLSVNPLAIADWNARFVPPGADAFFHTREWASVLHDTYGFEPCYVTTQDPNTEPLMLPLMGVRSRLTGCRGVALPFSDYCAPSGLTPALAKPLLAELGAMGHRRGWRYCELRSGAGFPPETPCFARYWRHDLDLAHGEAALFVGLASSVRTAIRKAVRAGVTVNFLTTPAAVREFYRLLGQTRRGHGLPPPPFRFFANLHRLMLARGMGVVALAHYEGHVIAAAVFGCHGKQVLFKYGASDKRQQARRAPTLLMWEAIRHFAGLGYMQLAMGRTSWRQEGLRRFKRGWGGAETEVRYLRYDLQAQQFATRTTPDPEAGYALFHLLPLPLARLAGAILYRHVG